MVPNCPRCQIVRGAKLSAVPNCPLLHYGAKLSWCQIVRGAKLSAVPNCPWCQIVHFYTMVPNCPPTWAVPNCPWCQIVLVPNCPRTDDLANKKTMTKTMTKNCESKSSKILLKGSFFLDLSLSLFD